MASIKDGGVMADKRIKVRVATYDGHDYTYSGWNEETINERHTVQQRVREVYPSFPMNCSRVELRSAGARLGVNVYKRTEEAQLSWETGDMYKMVMENDEVEIMLLVRKPWGPGVRYEEPPALGPHGETVTVGSQGGSTSVGVLLRQLRECM